jgi:hypothetical protein
MKRLCISFFFSLLSIIVFPQELMTQLDDESETNSDLVTATFKSTRVMNGHSTERMLPGQLDFRVSHRFGTLNSGGYNFFGLDESNIRLGLEYGLFRWMMIGIGRASFEKTFDGFAKFSLLRQSASEKPPVSVSLLTSAALRTIRFPQPDEDYLTSRMTYTTQLIVARKLNDVFSVQLAPTYIHKNFPSSSFDQINFLAVGAGARIRVSDLLSINGEYYYLTERGTYLNQQVYNPLSIGVDIETGGHVFQLILTNSRGMTEKSFISETTGRWGRGDVHFGFNISRIFLLKN